MAETLSYSIRIDVPIDPLKNTLDLLKNHIQNPLLEQLWSDVGFEIFDEEKKKSYVILRDAIPKQKEVYIPDRVNRCALETVGRIIRQGHSRKEVFDALMEVSVDPEDWSFQALKETGIYKKSHLIGNIRKQVENFISKYKCQPEEFLALQGEPHLENGIITYAPDDGQAGQFQSVREDDRWLLRGQIRLTESNSPDWTWYEFETELPEIIASKLEADGLHVKSPTDLKDIKKYYSWFYCPHCGYQGDMDYCASQNIAVRGLNYIFTKACRIKDRIVRNLI